MPRAIPPERFGQLIDVATNTFVAGGYATGTLCGYVEPKEALFDAGAGRSANCSWS